MLLWNDAVTWREGFCLVFFGTCTQFNQTFILRMDEVKQVRLL